MRYLLLIHGEEAAWNDATDAERRDMYSAYGAVSDQMQERGHLIDAAELEGAATATLVRAREGETLVVDGPFTETKEQLGGYFLVECDLDTAVAYAAAIPGAKNGTIEVRPVVPPSGD
jgi:hypothetical protein